MTMEMEHKIVKWAEDNPKFKRFVHNLPLLREMYKKHNKAKSLTDCIEGGQVEMTVMVVSQNKRSAIPMCRQCNRKTCQDSCGAQDYEERMPRSYNVVDMSYNGVNDEDAILQVSYAPFDDKMEGLDEDKIYKIEGTFTVYKPNNGDAVKQISPAKVTEIEDYEGPLATNDVMADALDVAKNLLEIDNNKVIATKWDRLMKEYSIAIPAVMDELKLERKDGYICPK